MAINQQHSSKPKKGSEPFGAAVVVVLIAIAVW